ncbi:MAG TPA: GNVR domain-containing protein [Polyangiaceae bacterium]|nr:GNVR domain-containing protein [Polyangiaceae bacterium]
MAAPTEDPSLDEPLDELEALAHGRRPQRWSPPPRSDRLDVGQLIDLLRQHVRFVAGVAALVFVAVGVLTLVSRLEFRSSGRLYLGELGDSERPAAARPGDIDLSGDEQADVDSEIEIITSRSLLTRAIFESGLNASIARAGWRPVRYWQWLQSGRDGSLLDGTSKELTVDGTSLDPAIGKPREYDVNFVTDTEYELGVEGRVLGRGRLSVPLQVEGLTLMLKPGSAGNPLPHSQYELTVSPLEEVTDQVAKVLDVTAPKPGGAGEPVKVVTLRFSAETPALASKFLRRLMQVYLEQRQLWKTENATAAEAFVTQQLDGMRGSLDQLEKKLADYRAQNRVVVQDNEGKAMTEQLAKYEEQRVKARLEVAALSNVQRALQDRDPPVGAYLLGEDDDKVFESLATSLSRARQELTDLEARFNPSAPDVREQRAQVEAQLDAIRSYVTTRLRRAQQNVESINGIIEQFERRLTSVPGAELGLAQLTRESEVYGRLYSGLLERQQQTAIVKASTISKNRILDEPEVSHRESSPKLWLRLASLPFGLLLGVGLVLGRGLFGGIFQGAGDIERSIEPLPVFARIPRSVFARSSGSRGSSRGRGGAATPAAIIDADGAVDGAFIEAFRTLRTNLYNGLGLAERGLSVPDEIGGLVVVTSPCPGDGKTTCALGLAALLAADGRNVLVLDADLRAPSHRGLLGGHAERDLGAVLGGKARLRDSVWTVRLPAGECHSLGAREPLPIELLSGEGMRRLLLEARVAYDFVVIDTPSTPLYSDALLLAAPSDCVLSVLRPHHSERKAAEAHIEGLSALAHVYGAVINDVPLRATPERERHRVIGGVEARAPRHKGRHEAPLLGRPISERGR